MTSITFVIWMKNIRTLQNTDFEFWIQNLTLVPLLGPIGGGLAAFAGGASPSAGAAVVAAAGAASSAALTTSLVLVVALFEKKSRPVLLRFVVELEVILVAGTKVDAAEAMLQLAMILLSLSLSSSFSLVI